MLFLSFDTGLESFSPLVDDPVNNGLFEVSLDLNQSLIQFSQVVLLASCIRAPACNPMNKLDKPTNERWSRTTNQVTLTYIAGFRSS